MIQALIGQKIDQTQKFLENGRRIPVTEIAVSDNAVMRVKTLDKDKYTALQLGFGVKKRPTKALSGQAKKASLSHAPLITREVSFQADEAENMPKQGEMIAVDSVFKPGDVVAVTGTSKGKGFAGVVKRHNFRGGPKTHGQSDRERAPGSIGQTTTPGRVYKGKRMAGRMGSDTVTVDNLVVVDVDAVNKKLYVLGLVPGHKNAFVQIRKTGESKKFVPLLEAAQRAQAEAKAAEEAQSAAVEEVTKEAPLEEVETATAEETVETPVETVEQPAEEVTTSEETVETVSTSNVTDANAAEVEESEASENTDDEDQPVGEAEKKEEEK